MQNSEYRIRDKLLREELCLKEDIIFYLYRWCVNMPDIILTKDWDSFLVHSFSFLYNEYRHKQHVSLDVTDEKYEEMEYFQMKYESDVHELYNDIQEIALDKNVFLFEGSTYEPLLYYLSFVCDCKDPYIDSADTTEDVDELLIEQEIYSML
jgi:hypothetical protein